MADNNSNNDENINESLSGSLPEGIDFSDSDGFVDFIDKNFEEIKIAGCTRDSCYIWVCK